MRAQVRVKKVQFKRSMLVSYLDEDLLVVRDGAGKADILERVSIKPTPPYTDALVEPADGKQTNI